MRYNHKKLIKYCGWIINYTCVKLLVELLASGLGIKEFLPAYTDPDLTTQELLTGVSFGSAGTGYDDLTAHIVSVLSMNDQLEMFKEYIEKLKAAAGEERAAIILSQSLYIVCAGNNDLLITYFDTHLRNFHYDIPSYIDFLVQRASEFIQELYKLGARKIAVACVPPLGCVPAQRTLLGGDQRECVASNNEASVLFNSRLTEELKVLSYKLPDFRTVCIDLYTTVNKIIHDPSRYGFEDVSRGCCGTGTVEFAELCNELSPHTCEDASKYAFWDGVHPTQRLYEIVVPELISTYLSPIL
ncbi:hypothetical protein ACLOJK_025743 [Asimina triloba]